ncbi:uncharacterized protein BX664DRAFT_319359 [Halteromyces radiatus]|uniref:uncharacterized protein n=1 Tax=Halteromyces radiatus TaxID=101107 RepID=UPI00221EF915|nr:uncharacterized protein BX664DRAFT_319359 [Halteromyces radiatus]KAI8098695.1 hypothetical protein BX664DRAFT_319359 [Halteromyces radiatus]
MHDPSFVIFSGGSACNSITSTFQAITSKTVFVLGVSDNGGSTSELLRVLGGPSIGDLRSRLTRLIKTDGPHAQERLAIKELMSYRLPSLGDEHSIRDEWSIIVEGRHRLWNQISIEKKETIRGFLVAFNSEILKRAHKHFNFRNGSIGNFFLTGARLFFGSLEAAIFLFAAITGINEPTTVVPVINTNHTAAIAAILENGQTLRGQCEISHPGEHSSNHSRRMMNPIDAFSKLALPNSPIQANADGDDGNENENLVFSKVTEEKLPAAIRRIYYMNEYGQEIYPLPNPKVIAHLSEGNTLVYSIGSLYTSILPCLILRGVGNAIRESTTLKYKILLLNGTPDRETDGYTAMDFIGTITNALNESQLIDARHDYYDTHVDETMLASGHYYQQDACPRPVDHGFRQWPPPPPPSLSSTTSLYQQSTLYQENTSESLSRMLNSKMKRNQPNLQPLQTSDSTPTSGYRTPPFPAQLIPNSPPNSFITHLIYLKNSGKLYLISIIYLSPPY